MGVYQISGLPASGKTTIQSELEKLGFDTIDTDQVWGYYGVIESGEPVTRPEIPSQEWFKDKGYIWPVEQTRSLLSQQRDKPLFVCGGSRNENLFYDLFSHIFVLHVPTDVMIERFMMRQSKLMRHQSFIDRMSRYNERDVYGHAKKN